MTRLLSATVKKILTGPNVAVLATLMPDGSPQTTAVWIHVEGDTPFLVTTRDTLKFRNIEGDGRVALTVFLRDDPYVEANIRGRISVIVDDRDYANLNLMSQKYYGVVPYPYLSPEQEWVRLDIDVEKCRSNKELSDE